MEEKVLTKKEAIGFLKISLSFLEKMIRNREIPFVQVGKRILFLEEDLITWLKSKRIHDAEKDRDIFRRLKKLMPLSEREKLFDGVVDYETYRQRLYKLAEKYGIKK